MKLDALALMPCFERYQGRPEICRMSLKAYLCNHKRLYLHHQAQSFFLADGLLRQRTKYLSTWELFVSEQHLSAVFRSNRKSPRCLNCFLSSSDIS